MTKTQASEFAWFNGELVARELAAPSVASNSFHMATGVFDGLMAYWNQDHYYLHRVTEHFERFKDGCQHMDLAFPWSVAELENGIHELLARCPNQTHYIRPICYRGAPSVPAITWHNLDLPVDVCIFGVPVGRGNASSLACQLSQIERVSGKAMPVHWKACGVYVNSFLAQQQAEMAGFDTGIMLDHTGQIAEASTSNIFFIQGNSLITPALSADIFPGITRRMVLEMATELGIPAVERGIFPYELTDFDGAFLCATLMEIHPISRIDNHFYASESHPVFNAILQDFYRITQQ